ncbi:MAG: aspartate 1-decarboxylase [Paludisphaera borealis]|uniref:aspartate 1-decarboxylase n=1 Tax=Paludisphaera borealis TaxID=1387353 RepID=UPI002848ADB7|nr:aspartate 1-decarboxylase [Paludisphaera borealis]MDR3621284.1 aspartate 1-decarboxylase [Paludisphaera borealis]
MQLKVLKSKLHLATVTRSDLYYHGSLTIDPDLMDAVGLLPYESILVSNVATGMRAETYTLPGQRGSGSVELNGAMARLGAVGDRVIVMAFAQIEANEVDGHSPRVVALDAKNRIVERIDYPPVARACEAAVHAGPDCWAGTE